MTEPEQPTLFDAEPQPAPERIAAPKTHSRAICGLHAHRPGDAPSSLFLAGGHLWWKDHRIALLGANRSRLCPASGATLCRAPAVAGGVADPPPPLCPCQIRPTIR